MDRARRTTANRRKPPGASASPPSNSNSSFDHQSSASPVMAHAINITPQTSTHGRRANKSLQQAFTFSTPGPNRPPNLRKRSKTMDDYSMADDDFENDSPKKGGHSLRKRARVDYTFEQIDDDVELPNSTMASSSRNKKRRSEHGYDAEDFYASGLKGRGLSVDAETPSSRRRNPSRKSSEIHAYREDIEDDENEVQDTIEVGISYSDDDDKSDGPQMDHSNTSSDQLIQDPQKSTPTHSKLESFNTDRSPGDLSPSHRDKSPNSAANNSMPIVESPADLAESINNVTATEDPPKPVSKPEVTVQDAARSSPSQELKHRTPEPSLDKKEAISGPQGFTEPPSSPPIVIPAANPESTIPKAPEDRTGDSPEENSNQQVDEHKIEKQWEASQVNHTRQSTPEKSVSPTDVGPILTTPIKSDDVDDQPRGEDMKTTAPQPPSENGKIGSPESAVPEIALETAPEIDNAEIAEAESREPDELPPDDKDLSLTVSAVEVPLQSAGQITSEPSQRGPFKDQPRPVGRWAHLSPYIDGDYVSYPEKKTQPEDEIGASEDQTPEDRDANDMEPMVDDNDEIPDITGIEAPTPALNTPTRGSPAPDSTDPTAANSPAAGGDDGDEVDVSDSSEAPEQIRYFRYCKLRDPEEYISAIEKYEDMSTADLYELLESINISLVQWQTEWNGLGKVVDDYENSLRRRVADMKYESRTRNLHQHGANHEEPDFVVKGYKARDREFMNETRYLQSQDRVMAAAYGFEYDPHPSKIGRQNPETQQVGIMTRGRSLRNQPKPTAKATEADEVTGKRQRKPVQLFDPATQDVSRSSTPVPTRGRRRRVNAEIDDIQPPFTSSFNSEVASDGEGTESSRMRRKRGPRTKVNVPSIVEELAPAPDEDASIRDTPSRSSRKARAKQPIKYDDEAFSFQFVEEEPQTEPKQPKRRHLLTLKIPRGKNFSEPSSAITDNGDSRPSTASSDSTSHTAESSYSFRPKRQKRFRDDPDESEGISQAPPKKRNKRSSILPAAGEEMLARVDPFASEMPQPPSNRKVQKIKVVRTTPASRKGTPSLPNGEEGDDTPKDYKSMTKSEKMSASMKSRWANGNMAGAVEKRKATLAAKKAAQAAAEQRVGLIAPKPKTAKSAKKDGMEQGQTPTFNQHAIPGVGFPFPAS